ncbi:MAG: rod shape-determining protein [Eubacteriales bacterium]|nr:rod shape-determining protein [Eubacteriales bacterium]
MAKEFLGIDLGTTNTLIYSSKEDKILYHEPTCLALENKSGNVSRFGFLADKIDGKAPYNLKMVHPVKNGLIDDDDACVVYLEKVLTSLHLTGRNRPATFVFTVPSSCSKVNRKAVIDIGRRLGAKEIYLESQARLAALGASKNAYVPSATLLLQIGSGISDIVCLSLGEIVAADTSPIAGSTFDEAIRRYLMQNQHLSIGAKSAEELKIRAADLTPVSENRLSEIRGRDTLTSLPSSIIVSSGELRNALFPLANLIALKVSDVVSKIPPELVVDLTRNGLYLSGGGALLTGLKSYLQNVLSLPVNLVEKPTETIGEGFRLYRRVLR